MMEVGSNSTDYRGPSAWEEVVGKIPGSGGRCTLGQLAQSRADEAAANNSNPLDIPVESQLPADEHRRLGLGQISSIRESLRSRELANKLHSDLWQMLNKCTDPPLAADERVSLLHDNDPNRHRLNITGKVAIELQKPTKGGRPEHSFTEANEKGKRAGWGALDNSRTRLFNLSQTSYSEAEAIRQALQALELVNGGDIAREHTENVFKITQRMIAAYMESGRQRGEAGDTDRMEDLTLLVQRTFENDLGNATRVWGELALHYRKATQSFFDAQVKAIEEYGAKNGAPWLDQEDHSEDQPKTVAA